MLHHRRATFIHRAETFFGGKLLLQDVRGILNLAAAGARQIAAQQWLQHQHERIVLASLQPLADDVGRRRPHL